MENLKKQFERELINLEIESDEELTVRVVTKKFHRKALRVHTDKTGTTDDEEIKQLITDYHYIVEALKGINGEEKDEKSDVHEFFSKHKFAKEFSQSWTIFVEKDKVFKLKNEISKCFPDPKNMQGNGT